MQDLWGEELFLEQDLAGYSNILRILLEIEGKTWTSEYT